MTMLAVAAVAFGVNELRTKRVTGESVVLVTSRPGPIGPGAALDASRLALTYANLIPRDANVLRAVGRAVRETDADKVRKQLAVINPVDTAILRLRYRAEDPTVAAAGARAAALAVAGPSPDTPTIGPGSVQVARLADLPNGPDTSVATAIGLGLALGLVLGIVLMLAWERTDPRVDTEEDAVACAGLPVTPVEGLTPVGVGALVERWSQFARGGTPTRVALLPVSTRSVGLARDAARPFEAEGSELELESSGPIGVDGGAEATALRSDVRVLVAARGVSEQALDEAVARLERYGAPADWLLFGRPPRKSKRHDAASSSVSKDGSENATDEVGALRR